MTRRVIGIMSGTSCDGLDGALIEVDGSGLDLEARFIGGEGLPLGDLGTWLLGFSRQALATAEEIATRSHQFGQLHIELIDALTERHGPVGLISIHGQTVFHRPPISWQLLQPTPIAHRFDTPVVYDLRQADLASGGQGAPLTPIADTILLRDQPAPWAVVNLGGFVNVTCGPKVSAADVCPGNLWLDQLARTLLGQPCDHDGAVANRGEVDEAWLAELGTWLEKLRSRPRSLGTGDEVLPSLPELPAPVLLRTAIEAIARATRDACLGAETILLAGGGRNNHTLRSALASALAPAKVVNYDVAGVPGEYREAVAWAILGALSQDREPISIPGVTGGKAPIAGSWIYP